MGAKEIIELLILAVSLIAPIMFNFLCNRASINSKKPYKLPNKIFYLESLISSLGFFVILGLYSVIILALVLSIKSNLTYNLLFIFAILSYNVYEKYLNGRLKKFPLVSDKEIMWFHNVKCKMRVQASLISLAFVCGIDNIFSISTSGNILMGWIYIGVFIITLPAYIHIYMTFFKSEYIRTLYEVRLINGTIYKVENLYETEKIIVLSLKWEHNKVSMNYLELRKEYISSIAVNTESIDIKMYLKEMKLGKRTSPN